MVLNIEYFFIVMFYRLNILRKYFSFLGELIVGWDLSNFRVCSIRRVIIRDGNRFYCVVILVDYSGF